MVEGDIRNYYLKVPETHLTKPLPADQNTCCNQKHEIFHEINKSEIKLSSPLCRPLIRLNLSFAEAIGDPIDNIQLYISNWLSCPKMELALKYTNKSYHGRTSTINFREEKQSRDKEKILKLEAVSSTKNHILTISFETMPSYKRKPNQRTRENIIQTHRIVWLHLKIE
ncbi:hypothetical protein ABFS83_03G025200 [Erythranthe nasuta]